MSETTTVLQVLLFLIIATTSNQQFLVASYIYPTTPDWVNNLIGIQGFVIINPNSGPGSNSNPDYAKQTKVTQEAGTLVLGYVHTSWGTISNSTVEKEVDDYYNWYGVNGIFFDEASTDSSYIGYYQSLYNYVKQKNKTSLYNYVVINPGTVPNEGYKNDQVYTLIQPTL